MFKRSYRGLCFVLSFVMLFSILIPYIQQYPAAAYAEERQTPERESFWAAQLINLARNDPDTNAPEADVSGLNRVEFEHEQYYAVRKNGYILVPVRFHGREAAVCYSASGGTAVAGVDYEEFGGDRILYGWNYEEDIAFIPIELIDTGQEGTRTIRLELHDPQGTVLGEQYWADVIIGPDYNYEAPPSYEYLYDGFAEETMFENWAAPWNAAEQPEDGYKSIILGTGEQLRRGLEHVSPHIMDNLTFQWHTNSWEVSGAQYYSVISSQRGDVTSNPNQLPEGSKIVTDITNPRPYGDFSQMTISLKDEVPGEWDNFDKGWYVGFYVEGETCWINILTVKMQKRQYDVRINIPRGGTLEVERESYSDSFSGRFDYEGTETLKAVTSPGYSFGGWMCYYSFDPDYVNNYGEVEGRVDYIHLSDAGNEITIHELVAGLGTGFDTIVRENSWIQLRPVFVPGPTYTVNADVYPPEGGTVNISNPYPMEGETVTMQAVPNDGYRFDYWYDQDSGNTVSSDADFEFIAAKNRNFIAYFVPQFYVEFECSEYYAVRADAYVFIPVSLVNRDPEEEIDVRFSTGDGTARAWIDYQAVTGELLNPDYRFVLDPVMETLYIAIRLLHSGEEWEEGKSIILTLHDPGPGVVLGHKYQAVLNILPHYDYIEEPEFAFLYDGYDFENTGASNWNLGGGWGDYPTYEKTYDTYKTLVIPTSVYHGELELQGLSTYNYYLMDGLDFGWKQVFAGKTYAVISEEPAWTHQMPAESSIVAIMENSAPTPPEPPWAGTGITPDDKQPLKGKFVGFYADEGAQMEVLYVEMQKKQFNIRVHLPGGSSLESAGTSYEKAFNGRFNYDSPDSLKVIAPHRDKFSHWAAFYYTDAGSLFLVDEHWYGERIFENDEIFIDSLITNMVEWADYYTEELQYDLAGPHWILLRPVFTPKAVYSVTASVSPPEGGLVTVSNENPMEGETVVVQATPNEGYYFDHWRDRSYNMVSSDADYEFIATEDIELVAVFVPQIFAEFEYPGYNVVRADDYVLIPVVFKTILDASGYELGAEVGYSIYGGTAVDGVDYEASGGILYLDYFETGETYKNVRYIPVKLLDSGEAGEKTLTITLHDPGTGVILGEPQQVELTIGPNHQYAAPPGYKYLYNGFDLDDTGVINWEGWANDYGSSSPYETTQDGFKTLRGQYLIQTKENYLMTEVSLEVRTTGFTECSADVAYSPGYMDEEGFVVHLPDRVASVSLSTDAAFQTYVLSLENAPEHRPVYVRFHILYALYGDLYIRTVRMQKGQYDVRVDLPGVPDGIAGNKLEVEGVEYEQSFSGRFDYDGEETLTVKSGGYNLQGWMYSYMDYDSGIVQYGYINGPTSNNLEIAEMVKQAGLMDRHSLSIQLRPLLAPKANTITVDTPNPPGGGSAAGGGEYLTGEWVTLEATAHDGYVFDRWTMAGYPPVTDNPWTFRADGDLTVTPNFAAQYTIMGEASPPAGGRVIIDKENPLHGDLVMVTAEANPGYEFVNWTEDGQVILLPGGSTAGATYGFNAEGDRHLVANFTLAGYEITLRSEPKRGGKTGGGGTYEYGSTIDLTAEPYSGYEFVNWTKGGELISTEPDFSYHLTEPQDLTLTANFRLDSFAVDFPRQHVGKPVEFDASVLFESSAGITFNWDFGDGSAAPGVGASPVSHVYTAVGQYTVTFVAEKGGTEVLRKTREINIVEQLPLENSDFLVEPQGLSWVEPGGTVQWTVEFRNNGVPMVGETITVTDQVPPGVSRDITTDADGVAVYETSVPTSLAQYSLYTVTFDHGPLRAARSLQVYSTDITLRGKVYDSYNGRYLENAQVLVGGKSARTDGQGEYVITGLSSKNGGVNVQVSLENYQVGYSQLNLVSTESVHNHPLVRNVPTGANPRIGKIYSNRSDSSSNVVTIFAHGYNRPMTFTATIDWGLHEPGEVHFILPDRTVPGIPGSGGYTASLLIDLDEEMGPGERFYVQAISLYGVASEPVDAMIELAPPPPFDPDSNMDLDVPKDISVKTPKLPFIGDSTFSLDMGNLQTKTQLNEDGTLSMYIGYTILDQDAKQSDLKDPYKVKEAQKLYSKLQKQKSVTKTKVEYELVVGGKIVLAYDLEAKDWTFREGWLAVTGSGEYTYTSYWMTPILIPVYVQCKVGGGLTLELAITYEALSQLDATLTPEMWFRLAAGAGVAGVISGEVFGKIHGKFTIVLNTGSFAGGQVKISAGFRAVFLFYSWEKSWPYTWYFPDEPGAQFVMSLKDKGELKPLTGVYLTKPSVWLPPEAPRIMTTGDGQGENVTVKVIEENVYTYSEPRLVMTEDGPMLVWVAYNNLRSFDNRTEVRYSRLDGPDWTAQKAIDDDGTADFYPQLAPATGWTGNRQHTRAAVTWVNMAEEFAADPGLDALLLEGRVEVAFYDGDADVWDVVGVFSSESHQDTSPLIGTAKDSTLVVWTRSDPSPVGAKIQEDEVAFSDIYNALYPQNSDLMFALWDGSTWSGPGIAVSGAGRVIKYSLAYDGDNALLAYTVDMDGDVDTSDDQELYYAVFANGAWNPPVRVTDNDVQDTNPKAVYLGGELLLFWYQKTREEGAGGLEAEDEAVGQVLYLRGLEADPAVAVTRTSDGLADFTLAANGSNSLALVWGDGVDEYSQEIFAAVYDPDFDLWSQPIQLTHFGSGSVNRSIDAVLDGEGNILTVFNRVVLGEVKEIGFDLEDEEEEPILEISEDRVDLVFAKLTVGRDLAVEEITLSEENPVPGSVVTISALVANYGELAEEIVEVAFYEGDPRDGGQHIGQTQILEGVLAAGEQELFSIQWSVPKELKPRDIYVVVDPDNKVVGDRNRSNNKAFISAAMANLEITEVKQQLVGFDEFLLTATVVNRGVITAEDVEVSLSKTKIDQNNDDLLENRTIGSLFPGEQKEVTLSWRYTGDAFDEDGTTFLTVEATSPTPNVLGGANTARVLVRKPVTEGGAVQGFELGRNALTLPVSSELQLQGIFDPPDANDRRITWESSDESIVQVDAGGKVLALAEGTAVITATTQDGELTDTCTITVGPVLPYGDVNGDGNVDVGDAIIILRHIVGLIDIGAVYGPGALLRAKVNTGGGDLDVGDAILILRYIVGLITRFPVEG